MNNELLKQQILAEIQQILEKSEGIKADTDTYCELMKALILNTYSMN